MVHRYRSDHFARSAPAIGADGTIYFGSRQKGLPLYGSDSTAGEIYAIGP
jgi:hypothetical protein